LVFSFHENGGTALIKRGLTLLVIVLLAGIGLAGAAQAAQDTSIANAGNLSRCLGIRGSSTSGGAAATIGNCSSSATQSWHVRGTTFVGGEFGWQFENGVHKCLGLRGGTGPDVVQGDCGSTSDHSQIWRPMTLDAFGHFLAFGNNPGPGLFWLKNGHTGKCMGLNASSTAIGTAVVTGNCSTGTSSDTQVWDPVF